jgi:hypothetical protein
MSQVTFLCLDFTSIIVNFTKQIFKVYIMKCSYGILILQAKSLALHGRPSEALRLLADAAQPATLDQVPPWIASLLCIARSAATLHLSAVAKSALAAVSALEANLASAGTERATRLLGWTTHQRIELMVRVLLVTPNCQGHCWQHGATGSPYCIQSITCFDGSGATAFFPSH